MLPFKVLYGRSNLGDRREYPSLRCWDLKSAWSLVSLCFKVVSCRTTLGAAWSPLLVKMNVLVVSACAEEACDETWVPLLDQGLVEASGSFVITYFWFEKVRPDSFS